jgi:uncharacterized membrane-anchored protein YitT (DUF2179 family)
MKLAIILAAIGVYFFKFTNNFSTGGVTGFAVVLAQTSPNISVTGMSNLLNIALLVVGILLIGRDFGIKTVYCTLLLSGSLFVFERLFPLSAPLTDQSFMELLVSMLLSASGAALLFHVGASSGGTDVVAMVIRKYTKAYNISTTLLMTDFLAAFTTFFVFDLKTGIFSVFGLLIRGAVLQAVLNLLRQHRYFHIITKDEQGINDFIIAMGRSATVFTGYGAYSKENRTLIVTVVSSREAVRLKEYIKQHSPDSFFLVTNTSDIVGNGFRSAL